MIYSVIDELAFQKNLLALNLTVDAARPEEVDKGFTVFAEEVMNLAQISARATKKTSELIKRFIKKFRIRYQDFN
jgi:methyl-accepting chemotaxis protein